MFSHFLAFSADKVARPEFFCWPGAWMAGERLSEEIETLFGRHEAPFMDRAEDGGIYPRLTPGKDERKIQDAFENFYAGNVAYDLTRQWIAQPGPFEYDYRWLSSTGAETYMKNFGARHFEKIYGVHPDDIEILSFGLALARRARQTASSANWRYLSKLFEKPAGRLHHRGKFYFCHIFGCVRH